MSVIIFRRVIRFAGLFGLGILLSQAANSQSPASVWPEGKQVAISLTFDDARESQVTKGLDLLNSYGIKATFFVLPAGVEKQLDGWMKAVASGHEIGNHSLTHPCTGNFGWSRNNALEDHTLKQMKSELKECNRQIRRLLGVNAEVFAYPCGQTYVGRGTRTKSYVPLVAKQFAFGRGWLDEAPNDPRYFNKAQLTGMEMDGKDFEQILKLIEGARAKGQWLVLAGHEMGEGGDQTTKLSMLKELAEYAKDPANGIWIAPLGTVGKYLMEKEKNELK